MKPGAAPSLVASLARILGLAAAYYVTGKLGLLLAIPPGYATAIWPPSGIALAGLLLFGYGAWPGICLGSFLVNVATSFDASSTATIAKSLALAASIGVGAALQAIVGAFLLRRFVGFPTPLDEVRDVVKFLALGGPVSCLINATVAVTTLLLAGIILEANYLFHWWTWWVGDTLGVFIMTPLVLIWKAEPREVWRPRWTSVALPLCATLAVSVLVFVRVSKSDYERIQLQFKRRAEILSGAVARSFDGHLEMLRSIKSFYASSQKVERHQFRSFVEGFLSRQPGIQALSWNPVVPDTHRAAYEEAARRDGYPEFQFTERDAQARLVRAAPRSEYVTVFYIEPYKGNESALGFDVASDATRLEALIRARDLGEPAATGRLMLVQETSRQLGFLVFVPVYRNGQPHGTLAERRQNLQGYVVGVFRINDLVEIAVKTLSWDGLELRIDDEMAPPDTRVLYDNRSSLPGSTNNSFYEENRRRAAGLYWSVTRAMAGRQWTIRISANSTYLVAQRNWQAWMVLAGGLLFAGLLGAFLLVVVTGRTARIELLVAQRTAELEEANRALQSEILLRKQGQEALAQRAKELEHSNAELERVASVASNAERIALSSLREKEVLLKEIHHRVKNNLQVISSLLNLQSRSITDSAALENFKESQNRVRSMALFHETIYASEDLAHVDLGDYIRKVARTLFHTYHIDSRAVCISVHSENIHPEVDVAIPCGLIANELIANCLKHAFPDGKQGEIRVELRRKNDKDFTFVVADDGIGMPAHIDFRNTESLGLQLVCTLVEQLGGTIDMERAPGTCFSMTFSAK